MTEAKWLACTDPDKMVKFLKNSRGASNRRWRLWACACIRRIWHLLADQRCRTAVEVAEAFAGGLADSRQLRAANQAASRAWLKLRRVLDRSWPTDPTLHDATAPAYYGSIAAEVASGSGRRGYFPLHSTACAVLAVKEVIDCPSDAGDVERAAQTMLLRCIFGNPFRPVSLGPAWLRWNDGTVTKIAQAIYDERRFEAMPILADALEDAGCDNADILAHCRQPGEHVRSCWVVDLLLGKE